MIATLQNKKFLPLLAAHVLGTFNDNLIKNVFVFLTAYKLTSGSLYWQTIAFVLYGLVFLGTSLFAGSLADKYPRHQLLQRIKLAEIGVMTFTTLSLYFESRFLMLGALMMLSFCMSFSRVVKYALIPDLVHFKKLIWANALLKGSTFVSSLLAAVVFITMAAFPSVLLTMGGILIVCSVGGYVAALRLPKVQALAPELVISKNPWEYISSFSSFVEKVSDFKFYLASIAWYWLLGGVVLFFAVDFLTDVLGVHKSVLILLTGLFSLGYIVGALLCPYLVSKRKWKSLAPLSAIGISIFLIDLLWAAVSLDPHTVQLSLNQFLSLGFQVSRLMFDVFALAVCGACFIIPFYPLLQAATPRKLMGRMFGFSSMICSLAVIGAILIVLSLNILHISILFVFSGLAVLNLFYAVYTAQMLPFETRQKICRKILTVLFDVKIEGMENLKKAGKKVLIVPNHTSYLDALIISAFIDQKITFSLTNQLSDKWWVRLLCNLMDVKALDPNSPFAVKTMVSELNQEKLCMIFTEGQVADGNTQMKIYEGPALMAQKAGAQILPIQIKGAEHTFLSRIKKRTYVRLFPKIKMQILPAIDFKMPENMTFREARKISSGKLYQALSRMAFGASDLNQTIFEALMTSMKSVGRNEPMMEDTERKPVKFKHIFLKAFILGRLIHKCLPEEKTLGVMLPTSNAAALTVLGLHAYGKVPAMINFTSGPKQVLSTCRTAQINKILTAKKVVLLGKLEPLVEALTKEGIEVVYLEEMRKSLTLKDKLFGLYAMMRPAKVYRQTAAFVKPSDPAVVLFTSGSEGLPKAVLLSHSNFLANIFQVPTMIDILEGDVMLNCLPMFHSFGLMAGTLLPLVLGMKTVLYPTPLHYRIIPELCASTRATILFGTDTFLAGYAKCANPYDFNSLRIVVAGAEKLKDETRRIWAEKFGVRVLEGYGATECSPVIAVNTPLYHKLGSVGRLMTGMSYQLKPVPGIKEGQELVVKGPNIMLGYMRPEKPGVLQPPKDGWYETGDIVSVDEEGFVFIKGRSKRFAKIGGEMVSLLAVEQVIEKNWPGFINGAVSVPDPKKGEQIVLITTCSDITQEKLVAAFKEAGITELAIPKKIILTDTPPLLGTGKFDYPSAQEVALKAVSA